VPCDARSTGWRGETRYARWRELRSDNRRENDGRRALRAPPVPLRFSAAHEARPRRTARAFADAFASDSPVFDGGATDVGRAAVGGGAHCAPSGARMRARKRGDVGSAEQRSPGVGARSALRTSDLRRTV
jgi:hypothetical protein